MKTEHSARTISLDGFALDTLQPITPQPAPTSERIKGLLSRALMKPKSLAPQEVQEIAASIVYHLAVQKKV